MDRDIRRDDIRRVLIAGDTHGNIGWIKRLAKAAADNGCPVIIQVGDFGYFPAHGEGRHFLTAVERACATNGIKLWFIDGNHDDHTSLANLEHRHFPVAISDHVTYLPRGTRRAAPIYLPVQRFCTRSSSWTIGVLFSGGHPPRESAQLTTTVSVHRSARSSCAWPATQSIP